MNAPIDDDDFARERQEKKLVSAEKRTVTLAKNVRRALDAADALGSAGCYDLDVRTLLHELPADRNVHWIRFVLPYGGMVAVDRLRLRALGAEFRRNSRLKNARAFVDSRGLHVRWGAGKGGLDYCDQAQSHGADNGVLVVAFSAVERSAA